MLALSPYIDLYAYASAYFNFHFPMGMVGINAYVSPTQVHLIHFDVTAGPAFCFSASMMEMPLVADIGLSFGWPGCSIGLFDVLFGEGLDA